MLILSLNIWGLGAASKYWSLKSLFSSLHPNIILLQESMDSFLHVVQYFKKCSQNGIYLPLQLWVSLVVYLLFRTLGGSELKLSDVLLVYSLRDISMEWVVAFIY